VRHGNSRSTEWPQASPLCYYGTMETLELKWVGSPQVNVDGRPVRFETRKVTALLAVLSFDRRPQSREYLAALLVFVKVLVASTYLNYLGASGCVERGYLGYHLTSEHRL